MRVCRSCSAQNDDRAWTCASCGATLAGTGVQPSADTGPQSSGVRLVFAMAILAIAMVVVALAVAASPSARLLSLASGPAVSAPAPVLIPTPEPEPAPAPAPEPTGALPVMYEFSTET